jgi:integrase
VTLLTPVTATPLDLPGPQSVVLVNRPLRPGTDLDRLSRFADPRWDLTPGQFEEHLPAMSIGFDGCPRRFELAARTYLWVLINSDPPQGPRPGEHAARISLRSIMGISRFVWRFLDFCDQRGLATVSAATDADLDAYLAGLRGAAVDLPVRESALCEVRRLWTWRDQLPAELRLPETPPWGGEDTQTLVGPRGAHLENLTPRLPEDTVDALLNWAIRFVDDFAGDITAAWGEYRTISPRTRERRPGHVRTRRAGALLPVVAAHLAELRRRGAALPGRAGTDGALALDVHHLARTLDCSETSLKPGYACRRAIDASGVPVAAGRPLAVTVRGRLDAQPWDDGVDFAEAEPLARLLSTACFIVIAYLSGMRPGEALSLGRGCVHRDQVADLWLVHGVAWKGETDETGAKAVSGRPRRDPWVVVEVVARAVARLEALHDGPLLFPATLDSGRVRTSQRAGAARSTMLLNKDLHAFVAWVNGYCAARGRRDAIPADTSGRALSVSRFRRTLAWHICRRPRGLVAGAIQYGHVATRITLGYAGSYASGFPDERAFEDWLARLDRLGDDARRLDGGEHVSGPAAEPYRARVHAAAGFAGRVLRTTAQARVLLANPALQVFPGHGMTCVFDARTARCQMSPAPDDARRTPAVDDCRPGCANIARTDRDVAQLDTDITRLERVVADPLSPPIRLQRERDELTRLRQLRDVHQQTRPDEPGGGR